MYQNQVNNTLIPLPHSIEQLPQQVVVVVVQFSYTTLRDR